MKKRLLTTVPLTGPRFGSYTAPAVQWLLTDLSSEVNQSDIRMTLSQDVLDEYYNILEQQGTSLADVIGLACERLLKERGKDIVLVSIVGNGIPLGVLMKTWFQQHHHFDVPHYAISLTKEQGIDKVALDFLVDMHLTSSILFIDGDTDAQLTESLVKSLGKYNEKHQTDFSTSPIKLIHHAEDSQSPPRLMTAILSSPILSGGVSSVALSNPDLLDTKRQFHGGVFYTDADGKALSQKLLDAIQLEFDLEQTLESLKRDLS